MSPMAADIIRRAIFDLHKTNHLNLKELGAFLRCLKEVEEGRIHE
tara:strand:- start:70 stop:204 length:135 start_codon:yes stop_codon:yes gene_type:complete